MERECRLAYHSLCEVLAQRQVALHVDGEALALVFTRQHAVTLPLTEAIPDIHLSLTRAAILDLVDGKLTLQEAILEGRVNLQGNLPNLLLFHEGWLAYMRGAIRCPSFPDLLERYRMANP